MSDRGITDAQLAALEADLAAILATANPETGEFSVRHCGMWAKLWGIRALRASQSYERNPSKDRLAYLRLADESAREWEKRKATAIEKERIDDMRKILEFISKQEEAATALGDIPE